ncbi:MAG: InlB B-repeat-containing protein, partial [Bacteroidota bacterium]|nr:InlB B-repeat-containing protein [Bacteroidota bacterium]
GDSSVTGNITVTATFAIDTYTLTYSAGANGSISGTSPQTVDHGSDGSAVTAVANSGYHFVNWSDASTANPRTDTSITKDTSVTANFELNRMKLAVKVLLQGPYNTGTGLMNTSLYSSGHLASHFVGATIPDNAVDSIKIEIRDSLTSGISVITKSVPAWLMADGSIRDFTDTTKGYVTVDTTAGNFYVVIRHRNHLAIMSASPVAIGADSTYYNFTTAQTQAYNAAALPMKDMTGSGPFAMWAGDVNGNGTIKYNGGQNDRSLIFTLLGGTDITATLNGYYKEDVNLNGIVKYNGGQNDRSIIFTNLGGSDITATKSTTVP